MVLNAVLILSLVSSTHGQRLGNVYLSAFNVTSNPRYVSHSMAELSVSPLDSTNWTFSTSTTFNQTLPTLNLHLEVFVVEPQRMRKFLNRKEDICQLLKRKNSVDVISSFIVKVLKNFGKIPEKCPVEPGTYYLRNITFSGMKIPFTEYITKGRDTQTLLTFSLLTKDRSRMQLLTRTEILGGIKT